MLGKPLRQAILCSILATTFWWAGGNRPVSADWELSFGKGKGQVGFLNGTVQKPFEEAAPLGPMAFRIYKGQAWVLDSLGGRVLCLDSAGRLLAMLQIAGLPRNSLLEDLALVSGPSGRIESVWVGDGADGKLRRVRVSDGRILCVVGARGNTPAAFQQIQQIEAGLGGALFVGDFGRAAIACFDGAGRFLREIPWSRSGFSIDSEGGISTIDYSENIGYIWRGYDSNGTLRKAVHLGFGDFQNPRLWVSTASGGILVSFVPQGGYRGSLRLVEFSRFGQLLNSIHFSPPTAMNRFLDFGEPSAPGKTTAFWLARGDFDRAPAGRFSIIRFSGEERR